MSRIAGLYRQHDPRVPSIVESTLRSRQASPQWRTVVDQVRTGALGWCGSSAQALVRAAGVLVSLDGAIYNRAELGAATSESDAALLARLYREYGFVGALTRINGDFAVALDDPNEAALWLARDRFGVKPLYYAAAGDSFGFASLPRMVLDALGMRAAPNREFCGRFAACHYRYIDNDPDQSPYEGVRQFPAASVARVPYGSTGVTTHRFWDLREDAGDLADERELAEQYRALLLDAVRIRLQRVTRPVFTLSGGMDSSTILGCAVAATGERQEVYSTVYDEATFDETAEIQTSLDGTAASWHPVRVGTPDIFALVGDLVQLHDEPVATATWLSHHLLCRQAATDGAEALFGGLGGDELNAGEYEHFFYFFADLRAAGDTDAYSREVDGWARHHGHPVYQKSRAVAEETLGRVVDPLIPGRCLPDRRRLARYATAVHRDVFDATAFTPVMEHPFSSYLKNRTYQDLTRETIPCCLRAEDRQATDAGLSHVDPFFDVRLVEFMFAVDGRLKFRDGVTKHLLRRATRGIVPEPTRTRITKIGWNAPAHVWFTGAGAVQMLDLIHSRSFAERGIYRVDEVSRLVLDHQRIIASAVPEENHMMFLWQLLNLETWCRTL